MSTVAEWSRRTYSALSGADGVGSIPANSDAQNVPTFRRWRFEMKLSPFFLPTRPLSLLTHSPIRLSACARTQKPFLPFLPPAPAPAPAPPPPLHFVLYFVTNQ